MQKINKKLPKNYNEKDILQFEKRKILQLKRQTQIQLKIQIQVQLKREIHACISYRGGSEPTIQIQIKGEIEILQFKRKNILQF